MNFWNKYLTLPVALIGTAATIALVQPQTAANNLKIESIVAQSARDGYQYQSYDNSYVINFPQKPQEKKEYIDTDAGKIYVVEAIFYDDKGYYSAMHMSFPVEPQSVNVEEILDILQDSFAQSADMSVVSKKSKTVSGLPGREVEMQGKNGGSVIMNLIFDPDGPTFYQTYVGTADTKPNTPEALAFLNSMTIQVK